jgi:hypothetical protein
VLGAISNDRLDKFLQGDVTDLARSLGFESSSVQNTPLQ